MKIIRRPIVPSHSSSSQRGAALALALLVVSVVAVLGAGYLQLSSSLAKRQASVVDQQRAFYLAEAGLAEAFQAVRMGRTGQVASAEAPASFGQGLIWVDVVSLEDGSLRLDSTGLLGRGRSRLSLVVEPIDLGLGFFADEDLVMDSVVLMDGWDSGEATYAQSAGEDAPPMGELIAYATWLVGRIGNGTFDKLVIDNVVIDPAVTDSGRLGGLSVEELAELAVWLPALRLAYPEGASNGLDQPLMGAPTESDADAASPAEGPPASVLGVTTGDGARLGSNGSVHFTIPEGEVAEVWGDVLPGPSGSVTGLGNVAVAGTTDSRGSTIELPLVELPAIAQAAPVRHEDLLPMLISSGTSGYERIEVAAGAELVIRGPATVLIDELVLEPSAILTLDTRAGEVALFVTNSVDLQAGSLVETSGVSPADTSLQVSSTSDDVLNPAVNLEATSQFYGTIYAPRTNVKIGSDFEIYGGVVARRLDVCAGARLHFDNSGVTGSALPRIIGWRVVEVPPAIRALRGNLFTALGLDRKTVQHLSDAHDLGSVVMDLTYIDQMGVERTYSGTEDQFDWDQAERVVKVERVATRPKEISNDEGEPPSEPEEPAVPTEPRGSVEDAMETMADESLKDFLISKCPLKESELLAFIEDDKMGSAYEKEVLMASAPLPESVLTALVRNPDGVYDPDRGGWLNPDGIDAGMLADVLIANSPLPRSTLDAVEAAAGTLLDAGQKARILGAQ